MVRITFLHPDLGIGGAERLVVDAALALQKRGHEVRFVTTHHDPGHCFAETKDGTIPVDVVADWLPRHIFGKFYALCAYVRMIIAAFYIILFSELPTVVICDLVSVCIPILKLRVPYVAYYCHYPDQLLSQPGSTLKSLYRRPLDFLEEYTIGKSDKVYVNSAFTQGVFYKTFSSLQEAQTPTEILHPSINTDFFDKTRVVSLDRILDRKLSSDAVVILSINRYERKKNLELAIKVLAKMKGTKEFEKLYLIIAGGYDKRVEENVEYHLELIGLADELQVAERVFFLRSLSDVDKASVLKHCSIVFYTPTNEHFGIVPLEAMYNEKPVLAHNSGGPRETVVDGTTGFLAADEEEFVQKIVPLISERELRETMGKAGRKRFDEEFSFAAFGEKLDKSLEGLMEKKTN